MSTKALVLIAVMIFTTQFASAATYQIDPVHSQVQFTVNHLVVFKVSGVFQDYTGEIEVDPAAQTLKFAKASIKVASIETRDAKRDDHLRSADFFDAANHPDMSFVTTRIEGQGNDIRVHGDLTIRGTTRSVVLTGGFLGETTDPWGNVRSGFTARTVINRHDFGLNWNKALETGGFVVGDQVTINLEIQGVRKAS